MLKWEMVYGKPLNKGEIVMTGNDKSIAKDIFISYNGSHFQMKRDGVYDEYKNYNICHEQEIRWIKEHIDHLLTKLEDKSIVDNDFMNLTSILKQYKINEKFNDLLNWAKIKTTKVDIFTNLRIAEEILDIVKSYEDSGFPNPEVIEEARSLSKRILLDIDKKPVTVAQYYKNISYLKDCIDDNTIKKRIKMNLEDID